MSTAVAGPTRIESLDQFRGYTVLGMFFVNFVGFFAAIHPIFKHHNTYCSYADTIMPHFFFAVGFAYRLTLLRRLETVGAWASYMRVVRRSLGLILLGFVIYHFEGLIGGWDAMRKLSILEILERMFKNARVIQTLVHIGITSIWVMPVIAAGPIIRIIFMCFSGALHVALSYWFYYEAWPNAGRGIDGGPLGFLTWTIPLLAGSLAFDALRPRPLPPRSTNGYGAGDLGPPGTPPPIAQESRLESAVPKLFVGGVILMALGYGFSCLIIPTKPKPESLGDITVHRQEFPFEPAFTNEQGKSQQTPHLLTMNQRAGSISYLTFGAGLSLALYAFFVLACDVWGWGRPRGRPERFRGTEILALSLAWVLFFLGIVAVASSLVALCVRITDFKPTPGQIQFIDMADSFIHAFDVREWTIGLLMSLVVALGGWEMRKLIRREDTILTSLFRTLGSNALAAYIVHDYIGLDRTIKAYAPSDAPLWYALAAFGVFLLVCYLFLRHMEKNKLYLRL